LRTKPRPGRPRRITAAKERAVISATLRKPKVATHWSARRLAKEVGLSSATVHRLWQKYGLQPHRSESFKFSRDPEFEGKLADIVGLYLDPPERVLVLCVDEKSQIQALNRTQPARPFRQGLRMRRRDRLRKPSVEKASRHRFPRESSLVHGGGTLVHATERLPRHMGSVLRLELLDSQRPYLSLNVTTVTTLIAFTGPTAKASCSLID
jgi:hypothetical protein